MQSAHGHIWECRAPSHDPLVFAQEIQYQEHLLKEHGVPEAHAGTLSNAARRPVLEKVEDCPFGDDFQPPEMVDFNAVFSSEALYLHVEGHMKEIALLTLQKLPSDEEGSMENVDSDQPVVVDGPAGAFGITRASMYSVLDDEGLEYQDADTEDAIGDVGHRNEDIRARVTVLDLEDKDDFGMTQLHHAVQAADLVQVKSLIQGGASVNARDEYGQTPLHHAAQRCFTDFIQVLVKHGAESRIFDNYGCSPILWAVVAEQIDAVMELLAMDADVDSSSADGKSALAWAASLNSPATAALLVERGASTSITRDTQQTWPWDEAAASGNIPIIELLLRRSEDANHRNRDGWSAIHWAAEEGHLEIVDRLLNAGANPSAVSSYGTSPLHCAANGGHVSIVDLLLLQQAGPLKINMPWLVCTTPCRLHGAFLRRQTPLGRRPHTSRCLSTGCPRLVCSPSGRPQSRYKHRPYLARQILHCGASDLIRRKRPHCRRMAGSRANKPFRENDQQSGVQQVALLPSRYWPSSSRFCAQYPHDQTSGENGSRYQWHELWKENHSLLRRQEARALYDGFASRPGCGSKHSSYRTEKLGRFHSVW